ncbi:zinc metalloproteinase nas-14-like isoform X2 [Tubulanus polymorphus]|uniref:zinc metalloproteinase nas-14-like isoform X2 n=1 Tax=Tubulanus polymorphus TaxID=672921 RepID=UPI003DA32917
MQCDISRLLNMSTIRAAILVTSFVVAAIDVTYSSEEHLVWDGICVDEGQHCSELAKGGGCHTAMWYMYRFCRSSCKLCRGCQDYRNNCLDIVSAGTCSAHKQDCRLSCGFCEPTTCRDRHKYCQFWAAIGECNRNPRYMKVHCKLSCEICSYKFALT